MILALAYVLAAVPATSETAVVFDAQGLNWEERCTVEALQGLANRSGPLLYLDYAQPWSRKWLEIYRERTGLKTERRRGLRRGEGEPGRLGVVGCAQRLAVRYRRPGAAVPRALDDRWIVERTGHLPPGDRCDR